MLSTTLFTTTAITSTALNSTGLAASSGDNNLTADTVGREAITALTGMETRGIAV